MYRGLKRYWRRRRYERLDGTGRRRKARVQLARAGGGSSGGRRRRFWRIKISPKLRFSPRKFLIGLRDAYVNFMLRIASSRVMSSSGFAGAVDNSMGGFGRGPLKEYDEKMIIEIYNSIIAAQGQFVPRDTAKIRTEIVCQQ